jgi:5'(3')-deoxyribonucleotidase
MDGVMVDFPEAQSDIDESIRDECVEWCNTTGKHHSDFEGLFATLLPKSGAVDAVCRLNEKFEIYLLSSAPWGNIEAWSDKRRWVEKYLPQLGRKYLILSHRKDLNRGSYLIDDRAHNGASDFGTHEGQEWIHFGSEKFPDWDEVVNYLESEQDNKMANRKKRNQKGKSKSILKSPYRWRCRICSHEGEDEELPCHCGKNVRQLAPVSDNNTEWFSNFLKDLEWKFVSPEKLHSTPNRLTDEEHISLACRAGKELEGFLNNISLAVPTHYELYNSRSDHLRVSDLKKKKKTKKGKFGFDTAVKTAIKWHGKTIPALKKVPNGPIELGHVFDEYFRLVFEHISSGKWAPGNKVEFYCGELDLTVCGTTDLTFDGIPVEMKTTSMLPTSAMNKKNLNKFKTKWRTNYLPQISMYSDACGLDWMLLLLISRKTGEFSLIPVNGQQKLIALKKKWEEWIQAGGKIVNEIATYRELKSEEE